MARRSKSEILEVLRGIPLFAHLPKSELRDVAKLCFEEVYETDHVILKQLEEAQQMVAIISGRARVTRDGQAVGARRETAQRLAKPVEQRRERVPRGMR